MSKQTYWEKLKDPRWQRKRLEIMQRDDFTCSSCGNKEKHLNVHHKIYRKGAEPWEYDDDNFVTYCEVCHEEIHNHFDEIKMSVKDSYSAMMLSCLAGCDHDALVHMNNIKMASDGWVRTSDYRLNELRIDSVKETISYLQCKIDRAEEHNATLLASNGNPFYAIEAMIKQAEEREDDNA